MRVMFLSMRFFLNKNQSYEYTLIVSFKYKIAKKNFSTYAHQNTY